MDTALGHISELAAEAEQAVAPLEERLNHLASRLAYIVIGVAVVFAIMGFLLGMETMELIDR